MHILHFDLNVAPVQLLASCPLCLERWCNTDLT